MSNTKKYIIGLIILLIIVGIIIWYRNYQKNKEIALAKTKLIGSGVITTNPSGNLPYSDIGKTIVVKGVSASLYNLFDMSVAYTKYGVGAFVGDIIADKTDMGNISFYKIINSAGDNYYALKSATKII